MTRDNSEDAVSWNVFRYLEKSNLLTELLQNFTEQPHNSAEIIYWSYSQKEGTSWSWLNHARQEFGEQLNRSSEPDIIIKTDNAIFFIEAKITATNNTKPTNAGELKSYLTGGSGWFRKVFCSQYEKVAIDCKKYELMRFWLLGTWLAKKHNLNFYLFNLVLEDRDKDIEALFNCHLKPYSNKLFKRFSWENIYKFIVKNAPEGIDKDLINSYFLNKTIGYDHKGYLKNAFKV
jgi:hypothetical protein